MLVKIKYIFACSYSYMQLDSALSFHLRATLIVKLALMPTVSAPIPQSSMTLPG